MVERRRGKGAGGGLLAPPPSQPVTPIRRYDAVSEGWPCVRPLRLEWGCSACSESGAEGSFSFLSAPRLDFGAGFSSLSAAAVAPSARPP